jgi:eukaryotic-like serine/threonine-protein kinase
MSTEFPATNSDSSADCTLDDSAVSREPVERAAEQFLVQLRAGNHPSISEWAVRYPDLAPQIRELFPALVAVEKLGQRQSAAAARSCPERLGDYHILREIGRGGMGIVYEAEHRTLGRHVALKVLPSELSANEQALQRFQREAKAAANLQHGNIVPVFDVGQDNEFHYYAMQFISGSSLDQLLPSRLDTEAGLPTRNDTGQSERKDAAGLTTMPDPALMELYDWCRFAARVGRDVASALHYAHAQGVLHRDIKPSNLMLDTSGTIWIVDFGLAQTDDVDITQPRTLVGTLRFMPPERFRGWCDPRSDVYSLGLTLYELLTLRTAFATSDRAELMRRINDTNLVRPGLIRPGIPSDLETIVLKAIEKEPVHRYQSADEMAADLNRFLEDRPILAHRTSFAGRVVRWCRRKPQVAALSIALSVVLLVATVGAAWAALSFRNQAISVSQQKTLLELRTNELSAANDQTTRKLYESLVNEAQARRRSHSEGQRFSTLDAVRSASRLLDDSETLRLRNEAIAALSHGDIRSTRTIQIAGLQSAWRLSPDFQTIAYEVKDAEGGWQVYVDSVDSPGRLWQTDIGSHSRVTPRFSPDGRFAVLTYHSLNLTELRGAVSGDVLFVCFSAGVNPISFGPSGYLMAVPQSDGAVLLYDLSEVPMIHPPKRIETAAQNPVSVCMHPQEPTLLIWNASDDRVLFHRLDTSEQRYAIVSQGRPVDLTCSPDGRLLAVGSQDFHGYIWSNRRQRLLFDLPGHQAEIVGVEFSADGNVLATQSWDQTTRLWHPESGPLLLAVEGQPQFCQHDSRLAIRRQDTLHICEVASGLEFQIMKGHTGGKGPWALDISPDGRLLASAGVDGVRVWDAVTLRQCAHLPVGGGQIALFHPQGTGLITGGNRELQLWPFRPEDGESESDVPGSWFLAPHQLGRTAVDPTRFYAQIADSGQLAWVADYGRIRIDDLESQTGDDISCDPTSLSVAISPDGHRVAVVNEASETSVSVYDADTGDELHRLPHSTGHIQARFSPDGRQLVTGVPGEYLFWDVETGALTHTLARSSGLQGAMAWNADGSLLALACGTIRLFDGRTLEPYAELESPVSHGIATALELTPDGNRLFAAYESRDIHCWDLQKIRRQLAELGLDWE